MRWTGPFIKDFQDDPIDKCRVHAPAANRGLEAPALAVVAPAVERESFRVESQPGLGFRQQGEPAHERPLIARLVKLKIHREIGTAIVQEITREPGDQRKGTLGDIVNEPFTDFARSKPTRPLKG